MSININNINVNNKIIDIRNSISYNKKHISNSINIPRLLLLENPNNYITKYETVYLICDEGITSLSTSKILNALGYDTYSIEGGIEKILN